MSSYFCFLSSFWFLPAAWLKPVWVACSWNLQESRGGAAVPPETLLHIPPPPPVTRISSVSFSSTLIFLFCFLWTVLGFCMKICLFLLLRHPLLDAGQNDLHALFLSFKLNFVGLFCPQSPLYLKHQSLFYFYYLFLFLFYLTYREELSERVVLLHRHKSWTQIFVGFLGGRDIIERSFCQCWSCFLKSLQDSLCVFSWIKSLLTERTWAFWHTEQIWPSVCILKLVCQNLINSFLLLESFFFFSWKWSRYEVILYRIVDVVQGCYFQARSSRIFQ